MVTRDILFRHFRPAADAPPVVWATTDGLMPYPDALTAMERLAEAVRAGTAPELAWLVQHPPLYTAGTKARAADLLDPDRFPVFEAGRGGEYTYHGPGQRVVYLMLDLKRRREDVRAFVAALEEWIIQALALLNIVGERREDRVGVWVVRRDRPPLPDGRLSEDKIAAIGVRLKRWVSFHGVAINVDPDLGHFTGIVPCGVARHGVTSLLDLGSPASMADLDLALKTSFEDVFGGLVEASPRSFADCKHAGQSYGMPAI